MKPRWIAAAAVIVAAAGLVVYKEASRSASPPTEAATDAATVTDAPRVVLVADPREAESSCGCGEIIRMVRSARTRGVAVTEVAPGSSRSREYHATVNPTVLFLDGAGAVVTRYEGEAPDTIAQLEARLEEAGRR